MSRPPIIFLPLLVCLAVTVGGLAGHSAHAAERSARLSELGQRLDIDPEQISVSGISSGAFMAHQLHVAYSGRLMGAGIIAGGPYYCAQGDVYRGMTVCTAFLATENCRDFGLIGFDGAQRLCEELAYAGPGPAPAGTAASEAALAMAAASFDKATTETDIDGVEGLIGDRVLLIHGALDTLLPVGVMDAANAFYAKVHEAAGEAPVGVRYVKSLSAHHSVPTDNVTGLVAPAVGACDAFAPPYLNACTAADCAERCCGPVEGAGACADPTETDSPACVACDPACTASCTGVIDAAGAILDHIYGLETPRDPDPALRFQSWGRFENPPTVLFDCRRGDRVDGRCAWLQSRLLAFRQAEVFDDNPNRLLDAYMEAKGYVFVPESCQNGARCRLHIAFHGCRQGFNYRGFDIVHAIYSDELSGWTHFIENAGYNEWADANDIVVLYPQAAVNTRELTFGNLQGANPQGCWDFWAYTDEDFHTQGGRQIGAVWRMVEALVPALR